MATYVLKGGRFVCKKTGQPMLTDDERSGPIAMPQICSDIPEYASPVTGEIIGSRSHRREDLKKNNCYEIDPPKPRGFKNRAWCDRKGISRRDPRHPDNHD
jgi:hypothetical protein